MYHNTAQAYCRVHRWKKHRHILLNRDHIDMQSFLKIGQRRLWTELFLRNDLKNSWISHEYLRNVLFCSVLGWYGRTKWSIHADDHRWCVNIILKWIYLKTCEPCKYFTLSRVWVEFIWRHMRSAFSVYISEAMCHTTWGMQAVPQCICHVPCEPSEITVLIISY